MYIGFHPVGVQFWLGGVAGDSPPAMEHTTSKTGHYSGDTEHTPEVGC